MVSERANCDKRPRPFTSSQLSSYWPPSLDEPERSNQGHPRPPKKNPKRWSRAECLGGARPTPTGSNWPASWKSQLWCLDWQHWWVHSTGVDSLQKSLASKKSLAWSTRCYLVDETLENLGFKDEDHKVMSHKHKKKILAHLLTIVVSLTHCKI